jgi:hypothetical protein
MKTIQNGTTLLATIPLLTMDVMLTHIAPPSICFLLTNQLMELANTKQQAIYFSNIKFIFKYMTFFKAMLKVV